MAAGDYWEIPLERQKEIARLAHRKRRHFNLWQRQCIATWRKALASNQLLPEQQRFVMRDIECVLVRWNLIKRQ